MSGYVKAEGSRDGENWFEVPVTATPSLGAEEKAKLTVDLMRRMAETIRQASKPRCFACGSEKGQFVHLVIPGYGLRAACQGCIDAGRVLVYNIITPTAG